MIVVWSGVGFRCMLGAEPDNGAEPLMGTASVRHFPRGGWGPSPSQWVAEQVRKKIRRDGGMQSTAGLPQDRRTALLRTLRATNSSVRSAGAAGHSSILNEGSEVSTNAEDAEVFDDDEPGKEG
ncbi:hypothetical protein HOY80DRAFT_1055784 [Tuber brumale]|nr:hypothetical protein HOY80DRAFT_1055784 [Tuber brumale]